MNTTDTIVTTVEGPNGTAEVIEIQNSSTSQTEYQVRHKASVQTFKSMGEAYITAKELAGVKM
jgi:hypothetical protein